MVEKNTEYRLMVLKHLPKEELTEGLYVECVGIIYQIHINESNCINFEEIINTIDTPLCSEWVRENFIDFCKETPETIQLNRDRKLSIILESNNSVC